MFKKIAVLTAALAVSAPALADHGNRGYYRNGPGHAYGHTKHVVVHHRPVVVHRPAVVHHVYHRPAPRPVYVAPRPVYVEQHNHVNPVAVLAGAVIGAAIVHHIATGY